MDEDEVVWTQANPQDDGQLLRERLTALLLTTPNWTLHYTATRDKADWMIAEANRLGWKIKVEP